MTREEAARIVDDAAAEFQERRAQAVTPEARKFLVAQISDAALANIAPDQAGSLREAAMKAFDAASSAEARARYDEATRHAGYGPGTRFLDTPDDVAERLRAMGPAQITGHSFFGISLGFWPFD